MMEVEKEEAELRGGRHGKAEHRVILLGADTRGTNTAVAAMEDDAAAAYAVAAISNFDEFSVQ